MENGFEFDFEALKKAGQITRDALIYGRTLIKPGANIAEVTDLIEEKIKELGGKLAFPVNISMNDTAAHNVAKINDPFTFKDEIIKLDLGAHVEGWAGDSAITIDLSGKNQALVDASEKALNNAIASIKPGVTLSDIGGTIEKTIVDLGFQPVRNLSGHQIDCYNLHAGLTIPNYDTKDDTQLEPGMIFAIEPFATNGVGLIDEKGTPEIFALEDFKPLRLPIARKIAKHIEDEYVTLPFSTRMIAKKFSETQIKLAFRMIEKNNCLKKYRPLVEKSGGLVSQTEHTIYIDEDWNVHILTK